MVITVTGIIELNQFSPENALTLKESTLNANCGFNVTEDCIYLSDIDNTHKFIEEYSLYAAKLLPAGHKVLTFKCSGETISDRRDIIIEDNRVFIQYYSLAPAEREEYKGDRSNDAEV